MMLKRLDKLKISVQHYLANHLPNLIVTVKNWKLISYMLINDESVVEVKEFLDTWNLSAQAKEAEALCWWNLNKSKYQHLASFTTYRSAPLFSVHSKRLVSEAGNLYDQKRNRLLEKTSKSICFSTETNENQNS